MKGPNRKVVLNVLIGGTFELSTAVLPRRQKLLSRADEEIIKAIEELGLTAAAVGTFCTLAIVEFPKGEGWFVKKRDNGAEYVISESGAILAEPPPVHPIFIPINIKPGEKLRLSEAGVAAFNAEFFPTVATPYSSPAISAELYVRPALRVNAKFLEILATHGVQQDACTLGWVPVPPERKWMVYLTTKCDVVVEIGRVFDAK